MDAVCLGWEETIFDSEFDYIYFTCHLVRLFILLLLLSNAQARTALSHDTPQPQNTAHSESWFSSLSHLTIELTYS